MLVEGTKLEGKSRADGTYAIANVPPGDHHLIVVAPGFVAARADVTVGASPVTLDVAVDPELHYAEVVSVSPDARSQFDSYQPTTVLSGQDLAKQLQNGLGATLANQPGLAERSFGPAPSRPVIRGLDGDRVLILEDGQRAFISNVSKGNTKIAQQAAALCAQDRSAREGPLEAGIIQ